MIRPAITIGFALWVIDGTAPPYQRSTFPTYGDCVVAGRAEVDSLKSFTPDITWQCLPDADDRHERQ